MRSAVALVLVLASVALALGQSAEEKISAWSKFKNCQECTAAGNGWCPLARRCGGFANQRCRGDHTDFPRNDEENKEFEAQRAAAELVKQPFPFGAPVEFNRTSQQRLVNHRSSPQVLVMMDSTDQYTDSQLAPVLDQAASMVGARALIVKMPITSANEGILPRFLVDRASTPLPVIRIASFMRNRLEAFGFILRDPDQVTLEYITTLVDCFHAGTAPRLLRSQSPPPPPPARYDGAAIHHLSGNLFEVFVLNPSKHVMVTLSMPGCRPCQDMKKDYEQLALDVAYDSLLKTRPIVLATVNAGSNDVYLPQMPQEGYPSIWLFPIGAKDAPIAYTSRSRSTRDMMRWLVEHTAPSNAIAAEPDSDSHRSDL